MYFIITDNQIMTENEKFTDNQMTKDIIIIDYYLSEMNYRNSWMGQLYCGKRDESPQEKCEKIFGEK
jgi:hypothetical protein